MIATLLSPSPRALSFPFRTDRLPPAMLLVPQVWLRLGASNAAANQRKRLSLQTPFHRRRRRRRLRPPPLRAGLRGRPRAAGPPTLGLASRGPTTATTAVIPSPLPRPTSTSPASPSTSSSRGATRTPTPPSSGKMGDHGRGHRWRD